MRHAALTIGGCALAVAALAAGRALAEEPDHDPTSIQSMDDGQRSTGPCMELGERGGGDKDRDDLSGLCLSVFRQNQSMTLQDQEHLRVILDYAGQHPDLRAHLKTLLAAPHPSDLVQPSGDGNWRITVPVSVPCAPGTAASAGCMPRTTNETIVTSGASMKLSGMYRSVMFGSDRREQLKLYAQAYGHLPEGFKLPGDIALPSPDSLSNAPLSTIANAVKSLGNAWQTIVPNLPPPQTPPSTASCDGETGSTPQHDLYGDRTGDSPNCTPSATGLFSALSDQQFPARKYLTCVKQQGNRLTCHAFADTSATEMMISQNHGVKVNLSEQDLMEHYRLLWSPAYMIESGDAYQELAGAIANNYFFPYESAWDYNPSYSRTYDSGAGLFVNSCADYPVNQPGCSETAAQAPGFCFDLLSLRFGRVPVCLLHDAGVAASPWQVTSLSSFWNPNDTELSKEYMILSLAFNSGVVLGFNVTDRFDAGGSGGYVVYDPTDVMTNNGGHYVHVVGIATNDELPTGAPQAVGGGYFIIKNSWNNCFGDAGYLYLDWDYVKAVGWAGFNVSTN